MYPPLVLYHSLPFVPFQFDYPGTEALLESLGLFANHGLGQGDLRVQPVCMREISKI